MEKEGKFFSPLPAGRTRVVRNDIGVERTTKKIEKQMVSASPFFFYFKINKKKENVTLVRHLETSLPSLHLSSSPSTSTIFFTKQTQEKVKVKKCLGI